MLPLCILLLVYSSFLHLLIMFLLLPQTHTHAHTNTHAHSFAQDHMYMPYSIIWLLPPPPPLLSPILHSLLTKRVIEIIWSLVCPQKLFSLLGRFGPISAYIPNNMCVCVFTLLSLFIIQASVFFFKSNMHVRGFFLFISTCHHHAFRCTRLSYLEQRPPPSSWKEGIMTTTLDAAQDRHHCVWQMQQPDTPATAL